MRRSMIVANWKMYTQAADAHVLATTVRNYVTNLEGVEVTLCPPAVWLTEVGAILGKKGKVQLGAQNMFYEPEGAYTGEISPMMLKDLVKYVIIGHSERRKHFGETNLDVNEKVIAALKAGLCPIVCVGEEKKSIGYPKGPVEQLGQALLHVPKKNFKDIVVAYEPIWAIGTGQNADADYVVKVVAALRELVMQDTPILYGGSVKSGNCAEYGKRPEIDGLLVGGASLRAAEFVKICSIWAESKSFKNDVKIKE